MKELIEIQRALHVPKDQKGHKYVYRKVDDILSAVKKVAPDNVYILLTDDVVFSGNFNYIKATAVICNGSESVQVTSVAKEGSLPGQSDPQISGSCSTYARKKALEGLFALDNDDNDPDDINIKDPVNASPEQIKKLKDYLPLLENDYPDKYKYLTDQLKLNLMEDDAFGLLNRCATITGVKK